MKKIGLLTFLALGLIFASCSTNGFKARTAEIELKGNPTTGYTWICTVSDESIVQVEEKVQYLGAKGIVGAPSRFVYTIKPKKPGATTIKFEYKRPWETEAPEENREYAVTVSTDGNVIVEEK